MKANILKKLAIRLLKSLLRGNEAETFQEWADSIADPFHGGLREGSDELAERLEKTKK